MMTMSRLRLLTYIGVGVVVFFVGFGTTEISSQTKKDPFEGTWKLNPARSWQFRGEQNKYEIIRIEVKDGVQTYRVRSMGARSTTDSHSGYSVEYNGNTWVPYENYIPGNFRDAELLTVKVDDRTHYRIARARSTGEAAYVLMRRMAADGQSYAATLLTADGEITLIRVFERCDEPCEPPAMYLEDR